VELWEKYHAKAISADTFKSENERIDAQVQSHNNEIAQRHEALDGLEVDKNSDNAFIRQFSKYAGLEVLTREAVVSLIDEVRMFSAERVEIAFNFADEYGKIATKM